MKLFNTIVCLLLLTITSYASANSSDAKQALLIGDNYLSKAKIKIIKESAVAKGLALDVFSARSFNKEKSLKQLCDYDLVMFKAVSDEIASNVFPKFSEQISQCKNVKSLRSGFGVMSELDSGLSSSKIASVKQYLDNGLRKTMKI